MRRISLGLLMTCVVLAGWMPQASAAGPFAPDPSWQANSSIETTVRAIAYSNTTMYIGGDFTRMRPPFAAPGTGEVTRNHAAAIDIATGDLLPWSPNVNGSVYAVEVVGSTVYLGGSFTQVNGVARKNLAAVSASTGDVLSWNPGAGASVREITEGPNGNLFVGGNFKSVAGSTRTFIAEITPSGTVTSWNPTIGQISGFACPPRCTPVIFTITFSVDGSLVYFGGHFGTVNGTPQNEVAAVRIDNDQALQPWDPDPYADANCPLCTTNETSRVYTLIVTSNKAYMCGGFWKVFHGTRRAYNVLVTNLTDGAPDVTFAAADDGDTTGCALHNGVFYIGGHFDYVGAKCSPHPPGGGATKCTADNSTTRHHAAAVDAVTGDVLAWDPTANSSHGIFTIQEGPGMVGFGGYFTKMGKVDQQSIAMYKSRLA
jgi:hypothetical protein